MNRKTWMIFVIGLVIGISGTFFILKGKMDNGIGEMEEAKAGSSDGIPATIDSSSPAPSSFDKDSGLFSNFEGKDPVSWGGVKTEVVDDEICLDLLNDNGKPKIENGKTKNDDPSSIVDSPSSNRCLKAVYPKGDFPGMSAKNLPKDWTGYNMLAFDVFNPNDDVVRFGLLVKDEPGGHGYANRYDGEFAFKPGRSKFVFNVTGLKTNDGKRQMDISRMKELIIFLVQPKEPTTIYFDNIRLEKAPGTDITGLQRFDFGTAESEVWPGFTQVTEKTQYRDDLGYGWQVTGGLDAQDRRYPDALFRDWVRGEGPFLINVDNGDYVVYLMLEDPGFWEYYQNYPERKIIAEGRVVGHEKLPAELFLRDYYFAHLNHEDLPGDDVFEDYVQKRFVWRRFDVTVEDKQLSLKFEPGYGYANTISALMLAPKESDDQVRDYLKQLDAQRKEFFDGMYTEKIPSFPDLPDQVTQQFEQRGYIPFVKNSNEIMFPHEPPRPDQVQPQLSISASPGETEPFVLGFYPIKDLGRYQAAMSDLTSADGVKISADEIQIRSVQYKLKLVGPHVYMVRGELLRNTNLTDFRKGLTRFMWFTVHVPPETPAGDYIGGVALRSVERPEEEVLIMPVKLSVLPIELEPLDIPVGMFYSLPPQYDWYPELKNQKWTAIEFQLKDMRDHGMNTLALSIAPGVKEIYENGDVELDFKFFDEFMRAYNHFGFNQSISGYGMISVFHAIRDKTEGNKQLFDKAMASAFKQISGHARQLAGQDILIGLADEVSNTGGAGPESVIDAAKVLKQAGISVTGFFNGKKDVMVFPHLTAATINNGVNISESLLKKTRDAGADIWFYNIGQNRFSFGYYLWRTQAKGRVQWHYQLPAVDPFFDLDGRESDYCASYPSPFGPINAVWFEQAREGIYDYRYLRTLEKKIAECSGTRPCDSTNIENAEKLLDAFRNDISVKLNDHQWLPSEYDQRRADVVRMILQFSSLEPQNPGTTEERLSTRKLLEHGGAGEQGHGGTGGH